MCKPKVCLFVDYSIEQVAQLTFPLTTENPSSICHCHKQKKSNSTLIKAPEAIVSSMDE
jgi:hypothetical protein